MTALRVLVFECLVAIAALVAVPVAAAPGTMLEARHHFLAEGSVYVATVYDSPGTEVYPAGATNGDKHGTIRWEPGGKYADTRKTFALFGMRLIEGNPGRIFDFHTHPSDEPWGWTPPGCATGGSSNGVAPIAIDYFGDRGLELVVEPNNYVKCGGTGRYHYRIMSPREVESRRGAWIYIWLEVLWGRVDGSTRTPGGVRVWVAGESKPRVNRQRISTHWYEQGMVTFWQMAYWAGRGAPTNVVAEHTAPRFGRTPQEALEDTPSLFSQWGGKSQGGSSPLGDGWYTSRANPRPSTEPRIPSSLLCAPFRLTRCAG